MENIDILAEPINITRIGTDKKLIFENDKIKVLYFKFKEGKGLPNHVQPGIATIQVINGMIKILFAGDVESILRQGDFMVFEASHEHSIISQNTSEILVTIAL